MGDICRLIYDAWDARRAVESALYLLMAWGHSQYKDAVLPV